MLNIVTKNLGGVRGSVVLKALYYKSEGRGIDKRLGEILNLANLLSL
jgi:hypothetical protein